MKKHISIVLLATLCVSGTRAMQPVILPTLALPTLALADAHPTTPAKREIFVVGLPDGLPDMWNFVGAQEVSPTSRYYPSLGPAASTVLSLGSPGPFVRPEYNHTTSLPLIQLNGIPIQPDNNGYYPRRHTFPKHLVRRTRVPLHSLRNNHGRWIFGT